MSGQAAQQLTSGDPIVSTAGRCRSFGLECDERSVKGDRGVCDGSGVAAAGALSPLSWLSTEGKRAAPLHKERLHCRRQGPFTPPLLSPSHSHAQAQQCSGIALVWGQAVPLFLHSPSVPPHFSKERPHCFRRRRRRLLPQARPSPRVRCGHASRATAAASSSSCLCSITLVVASRTSREKGGLCCRLGKGRMRRVRRGAGRACVLRQVIT